MKSLIGRFAAYIILLSVLLFYSSGRLDWINAWVYLIFAVAITAGNGYLFYTRSPGLIQERMTSLSKENIKPWDKILVPLVAGVGPLSVMLVSGLEARFSWPPAIPGWASAGAFMIFAAGYGFVTWAMLSNKFFSAVVRIQKERGHKVVDSGPYAHIRHPGYAGGIIVLLTMPIALGSIWALIPAAVTVGLYILRTALEDRTLAAELEGYKEYSARVRYRLFPGVW